MCGLDTLAGRLLKLGGGALAWASFSFSSSASGGRFSVPVMVAVRQAAMSLFSTEGRGRGQGGLARAPRMHAPPPGVALQPPGALCAVTPEDRRHRPHTALPEAGWPPMAPR